MSNSVNLSLDVTKTGIQNPLIKVRQGDGGFETLHTTVTSNGEPMDLQGWTITFMGTTAGNHKIVDGNVNIIEAPNGIFDYTPSKAWGMDIGEFKIAYFKFVKGDGAASSANFRVNVIEAVDLTQEEAQNYISVVDTTIAEIRDHLTNSLASVTASVATTSSAASSMAVYVSSTASSAVNTVNTNASNAVNAINNTASSAVNQVNSAASSASSVASSAVEKVNGVASQVNSLSVGGRNLLFGTRNTFTGVGSNSNGGDFNAQGGIYYLTGFKKVSDLYNQYGPNSYLTLSFDWDASGDNISGQFNPQWNTTPWVGLSNVGAVHPSKTNTSGHYKNTVSLSYDGYSTGVANAVMFRQDNLQGNVTISNVKLEAGNIATDWTPAPEDVPSNDGDLTHKTGTETIAGDKTFTGKVMIGGGNYQTTTSSTINYFGSTISFVRIGNQVTFTSSTSSFNSDVPIGFTAGIIPVGFRPVLQQNVRLNNQSSAGAFLSFDDGGGIYSYNAYSSGTQPRVSGSYITTNAWPV